MKARATGGLKSQASPRHPAPPRHTRASHRSNPTSSVNLESTAAARRAISLCFLLNGFLFANWVSRIPAVQARLGLAPGELGLALLALGLGAVLAMPLAGWCAGR